MQVWNALHAARWKYSTQKIAKNSPSAYHRTNFSGYISQQAKTNLLNSNMSSTCPHNMVNVGSLTAEIGSGVWGTPTNFNWFCVLASLLQRRRSTETNQTLHDVWPSPALTHYEDINTFGGCCPRAAITLDIGLHSSSSSFPRLISAVPNWMSTVLLHVVWP